MDIGQMGRVAVIGGSEELGFSFLLMNLEEEGGKGHGS